MHDELVSPPKAHALRVVGLLGSGQFASVWRVDDGTPLSFCRETGGTSSNEHEFALKKCCKRTAAQERKGIEHLLEEKQAQASLNHPAIVTTKGISNNSSENPKLTFPKRQHF